ncbi:MAG: hypothetical protein GY795_07390 [Desulfobacterales bacterium]|nr:hypothetical protein [Desulfobacterales bacterium]
MKDYHIETSEKSLKLFFMAFLFAALLMGTACSAFAAAPSVTTADISSISSDNATSGGEVVDDGGSTVIVRGVCWNTSQIPTADGPHTTDGGGVGTFTSSITDLAPGITYYVRAYAFNSDGTGYGEEKPFTTLAIPVVKTSLVSSVTRNSALSGGNVTYDGGFGVTEKGVCWSTQQSPNVDDTRTKDGTGTGYFTSSVSGLMPGTTYYVRAYATNSKGTAYGSQVSFTTTPPIILYVKYDASDSETGESWEQATSLQTAIASAQGGDDIWVAAGTYKPGMSDRTASFELKSGVGIYGGFTGTETSREQRDWRANITILSGDIGAVSNNSDNSYHVVISDQADDTAVLDGFTITGGNADGSGAKAGGGGMYNYYGSPNISNCTFNSNSAVSVGGGMYNNRFSSPVIFNCIFSDNTAGHGGGMCNNNYSSPSVSECTFTGNSADDGGGMRNENFSDPEITGSTFENNIATFYGGGMYNSAFSSPNVAQCLFTANASYNAGGGMCNSKDGDASLINCTFAGNTASNSGGGMYNSKDSLSTLAIEVSVINCTLVGNYSDNNDSGIGEGGGIFVEGASVTLSIKNTIVADNYKGAATPVTNDCFNENAVINSGGYNIAETGAQDDFDQDGDITGEQADLFIESLADNGGPTETCGLSLGSIAVDAGTDEGAPDIDQRGYQRFAMPDIGAFEFKEPAVITYPVTSITDTGASCGGNVTFDRGFTVVERGVCWNTAETPTTDNSRSKDGTGKGAFTSAITGLDSGTVYYVRAYAENQEGLVYGEQQSFKTVPAAPVPAGATGITATEFTANWNPVVGTDDYRLDVSDTNDFSSYVPGFQHKTVSAESDLVTGLTPGTTYYYRVRAVNISGYSAYSGITSLITIPGPPNAVPGTDITTTGFTANWNAATGAESYFLDVSTSSVFTSYVTDYQDKPVTGTSDAVTGLTAITTYYYRVRAVNASGTGESSNIVEITTAPSPPVVVPATEITTTGFTANWNSSTGAISYLLDVSVSDEFDSFVTGYEGLAVPDGTNKGVTDLSPGSNYYYRVRAVSESGISNNSDTQDVITVPDVPEAFQAADITDSSFTAVWETLAGTETYRLDVSASSDFTSFVTEYENLSVSEATKSVTGLSSGTLYYYRVRAVNEGGTSENSNIVTVVTVPDAPAGSPPTDFSTTGFTANWEAVTGADRYYLDVSESENFGSFVSGYHDFVVISLNSQIVSGLEAGTVYYYRVRSENFGGASGFSNVVSSVTVPPAPAISETSDITQTGFTANWKESKGADTYRLDISEVIDFSTFVPDYEDKAVTGTSENVTGLQSGKSYYYRVRAANDTSGASGNSVFAITKTLSEAPLAADASDITEISFTANWSASAGAETYHLDVSVASDFSSFVDGYDGVAVGNKTSQGVVVSQIPGMTYYYRVRAVNAGGTSESSNTVTVMTVPAAPVVASPSDVTESSFTANWNASEGAQTYRLDVSTLIDFSSYVSSYEDIAVSETSYNVTGLTGGFYYYRVRAVSTGGTSKNSTIMTARTSPAVPQIMPATNISQSGFTANWSAASSAESYRLDVSATDDFSSIEQSYNDLSVGNKTSQSVIGLLSCKTYYYRVRAVNSGGTGNNSNVQSVEIRSAPVLTTISATSVTMTGAESGGDVTNDCGDTITKRGVCWNTSLNPTISNSHTTENVTGIGIFNSTISGLNPGTTYYVRAYATNSSGTSYGNNATFTTNAETGDIDGSGTIDLADAVLALKVLAGLNPGGVHSSADVNGDGRIGIEEAINALRAVSKF